MAGVARPGTGPGVRPAPQPRLVRVLMTAELLLNAVVAGLLLGGFYAAVTVGISISFGMLDVVNIAHPAFIIVGSYVAYILNSKFGIDPVLVGFIAAPLFFLAGALF